MTDPEPPHRTASSSAAGSRRVHPIRLRRTAENAEEVDRLIAAYGTRVGLAGVLDRLNRSARAVSAPGGAVSEALTWAEADVGSPRWWPQGITSSADATGGAEDRVLSRRLLVTSWYSRHERGANHGSRISIVDTDARRYRHVLLVVPEPSFGEIRMKALTIHAGGLAWYGSFLHVAGTRRGLVSCRLEDITEVEPGPESFGHRFVLPVRFGYDALAEDGTERLRYSFLSLDHRSDPPELVAGEYGTGSQTTRLIRFPIDPATEHLLAGEDGASSPVGLDAEGRTHMQGAVVVGGTWYVTVSRGTRRRGHLLVGRPGAWRVLKRALPPGPEDITYWPQRDRLWSLTEHPGKRWIVALDRPRLPPP